MQQFYILELILQVSQSCNNATIFNLTNNSSSFPLFNNATILYVINNSLSFLFCNNATMQQFYI